MEDQIIAIRKAAIAKNIDHLGGLLAAFRKEHPQFNAYMLGELISHVGYIVFGSQGQTFVANRSMTQVQVIAS